MALPYVESAAALCSALAAVILAQLWLSSRRDQRWRDECDALRKAAALRQARILQLSLRTAKSPAASSLPAAAPPAPPHDEELALIRDMLELRTLTDLEFSHPQELLREFLQKLAMLTAFDQASVYLQTGSGDWQRLAVGGVAANAAAADAALPADLDMLRRLACLPQEPLWQQSAAGPWQTTLLAPLCESSLAAGCLLLSSRRPLPPRRSETELAKWSAQFLPKTFEKALVRMQMEDRARRDALTQTANRHAFDAELEKLLRRCSQEAAPCSLLLLDVDHFKSINDQHGHLVGDAALKAIAQAVQQTVHHGRATDRPLVARYGGEEFAVLLPDLPLSAALRIAEEIRLAIERLRIPLARGELRVTASLGASASPEHGDQPQPLLHAADQALYAAKRAGRNRVLAAGHALVIRSEPAASARELSATVS